MMANLSSAAIACGLLFVAATFAAADDAKTAPAAQKGKQSEQKLAQAIGKAGGAAKTADADQHKRLAGAVGNNRAPMLSDIVWDLFSDIAFKLLSGNSTELLSDNEPELLSGNEAELLSDNEMSVLSENEVEFLSGNDVNLFSGFSITINVQDSGKKALDAKPAGKKTAFAALDRSNDGRLTFKEFQGVQAGKKTQKLRKRFDRLDENADGVLTPAEFQSPQGKKGKKRQTGRESTGD